jgi:hypothetical protein
VAALLDIGKISINGTAGGLRSLLASGGSIPDIFSLSVWHIIIETLKVLELYT